jgi:hypothetical protein
VNRLNLTFPPTDFLRPWRFHWGGCWHHISSRRNERKEIFRKEEDRPSFSRIAQRDGRSGFERGCCLHSDGRSLRTTPDGRSVSTRPVRLCSMPRLDPLYNFLFVLCPDLTPIVQSCTPLSGRRNALVGDGWKYFRKPSRHARTFHSRSQSKD